MGPFRGAKQLYNVFCDVQMQQMFFFFIAFPFFNTRAFIECYITFEAGHFDKII